MPMQSVLDITPLEIFELILNANRVADPTDYHHLRLLCRLANEVLEPHVFSKLTIRHDEDLIVTKVDKLAAIASSASPYARWAKTIAFRRIDPDIVDGDSEDNDNGDNGNDDPGHSEHGGDAVVQLLLDALKSLKGVEEVHIYVQLFTKLGSCSRRVCYTTGPTYCHRGYTTTYFAS
ncbi:hypothetical protein FA13DRAFT_331529 [Coprinellus micaceus]|uniref:Uncharacterized protein n=1 Tax=Coprinellus micaceus TaxID=71717 RepID=A0A4Y7TBH0_COPMI|nr:hypothetical protein FA13DRAFT_331529 [Coprinellus micaceus]